MKLISTWSNTRWSHLLRRALVPAAVAALCHAPQTLAAKCEYVIANQWNSGFTATVRIVNDTSSAISGWNINWSYTDDSRVTSSWNATLSGNNPYTAAPVGWNSTINPGQSVEFGVQGTNGGSSAQIPTINGAVCSSTGGTSPAPTPSSAPRSSSVAPAPTPSSVPRSSSVAPAPVPSSSRASSSVAQTGSGESCNWYGTPTPLCANTTSGWGYENNKSCVSRSTCQSQPAPWGIGSGGTPSSQANNVASSSVRSVAPQPVASSSLQTNSSSSRATSSSGQNSSITLGATCNGYATRYWDCCKSHCSWNGNVPSIVTPLPSCAANNTRINDASVGSSCDGGSGHMCYSMAPFAVSDKLSYGFAATANGDVCGRCYQLEFTGSSYNSPGDPGSSALAGKVMIVQATNIGYDVNGGQFDILVPGGGVGLFNACSAQWGVSNSELGAQYGGFLAACKQELGYNASLSQYKSCLRNRCDSVFGSRGLTELQQACVWYADWFEAADNPSLKYKEVACPAEIIARSGVNRGPLNDIKNTCN
jgi:hypothetical protein